MNKLQKILHIFLFYAGRSFHYGTRLLLYHAACLELFHHHFAWQAKHAWDNVNSLITDICQFPNLVTIPYHSAPVHQSVSWMAILSVLLKLTSTDLSLTKNASVVSFVTKKENLFSTLPNRFKLNRLFTWRSWPLEKALLWRLLYARPTYPLSISNLLPPMQFHGSLSQ